MIKKRDKQVSEVSDPSTLRQRSGQAQLRVTQKEHIDKIEQEAADNLAGWQRAKADYENLKKQTVKEREAFVKYANYNLIMELLPIFDNFKLAFNSVPEAEQNNPWVIGLRHIKKQMEDFLTQHGVEKWLIRNCMKRWSRLRTRKKTRA